MIGCKRCGSVLAGAALAALWAAPALAQTAAGSPGSPIIQAMLPRDLSPWGMFESANLVVKAVLLLLLLASVATWTVWLAKSVELIGARRRLAESIARIAGAASLAEADQLNGDTPPAVDLIHAAAAEIRQSADMPADGIKERVASRLERIEAAANRRMLRGTGILATIGATSPFIGLFGTVWGIMNSFIGISKAQTTNLAVVAPGIAEALLATALGLVAAIPAVVIYNAFARSIAGYRQRLGDISADVLRIVSRDLDRRRAPLAKAAE